MTKAFIRPRPVRIAFFVEEHAHWPLMLQEIYANCFARWGGRFNLIVPVDNGQIRPAYLPWLRAYDPDILYSYCDFPEESVKQLHEDFFPAFLTRHRIYNLSADDAHAYRPQFGIEPLSSLSVTSVASRGNIFSGPQPVKVVDHFGQRPSPQFVQENFGFYSNSLSPWPIPAYLAQQVCAVALTTKEIVENPQIGPKPNGDFLTEYSGFLDRLTQDGGLWGLGMLSAWLCPRLQMNDPRWTNRVNIIIGDSFADRIVFWNARSHLDVYLDTRLVTLKLSKADIEDAVVFPKIIELIKKRIHVSHGNNNSHVTLRSASHSAEDLTEFAEKFRRADQWNMYAVQRIESVDDVCPDQTVLAQAMDPVEDRGVFQEHDWHEIEVVGNSFRPPIILPRHIRDAAVSPELKRGAWALDLDIERSENLSRFENVTHRWRLPRRLRMTTAFCSGYQLRSSSGGAFYLPRVQKNGLLTLFGAAEGQLPEVNLPSDERAFRMALVAVREWLPFVAGKGPDRNSLYYGAEVSDKGRYLTALLHLGGGVHGARDIFLKKFWKQQFEFLGASPSAGEERLPELVQTLKKRFRAGTISSNEEWERLARSVIVEARSIRLAPRYMRFDTLAGQFDEFRDEFWKVNQPGVPREEWDEDERRSLADSVQYLCQREILHQGHEWRCRRCNYNNWVSVDDLKRAMVCEVCGNEEPAPVATPWRFKLNSFVLDGLRAHGLLANLWCLSRLSDQAQASFFFLAPHELFITPTSAKPEAEVDLIVVVDGIVRLCEVKTSGQNIDLEKFAALAKSIRPDIATLAVMERAPFRARRLLNELQGLLTGTGIEAEVLTLRDEDIDDSPHLPTGRTVSYRLL